MKNLQGKKPSGRVQDEPEDERPLGTGEEVKPDLAGMAVDPYAEDLLYDFRYRHFSRRGWIVVALATLLFVVAASVVFLLVRAWMG